MKFDDGIVTFYEVGDYRENGLMPQLKLTKYAKFFFKYRTVGYGRFFAAGGLNIQLDSLIRVWQDRRLLPSMVAKIGDDYYQVIQVQHLEDENELRVSDVSLRKLEKEEADDYYIPNYDGGERT